MAIHADEAHGGQIKFKFRVLRAYRSAMERQIAETVKIKLSSKAGVEILNNRAEYNRCLLPELEVRLGKHKQSEVTDKKDEERVFKQGRKIEKEEEDKQENRGPKHKRKIEREDEKKEETKESETKEENNPEAFKKL